MMSIPDLFDNQSDDNPIRRAAEIQPHVESGEYVQKR